MKPLILYHANCNDGFGAAWVAFHQYGKEATYTPMQFGDPPPKDVDGKDVLILDFSFARQVLVDMNERANSLLVLDHHVTAEEDLRGLDFARFDQAHSGCVMTWRHFQGDEPVPWLLDYIEDRDLWAWKLEQSDEVAAGLQSYARTFQDWDSILARGRDRLVAEGKPIVRFRRRLVEAASSRTRMIDFDGHHVPCINSCVLQSEIGSRLAKRHPFVVIAFEMEGRRVVSLRSHPKKGLDVAAIARKYGGGGHKNAAGFTVPLGDGEGMRPV